MMDAKHSFLAISERLEGFVGKLPASLQNPILHEITPLKDLFLRQRAPRFALAGDPDAGSASLFNAIFGAPVAPFAPRPNTNVVSPTGGWADFTRGGKGVLRLLDARSLTPEVSIADDVRVALLAERPDLFLFLVNFPATPESESRLASQLDRLEALLELSAHTHPQAASILGLVVASAEKNSSENEMASARIWLHAALTSRAKIAPHLVPSLDVSTFMRFRLDGTYDGDSDRRRNVTALVRVLVEELPNESRLEMARLSGAREAQAKIAQTLVKSMSAVSGAVGAQPIPLADLPFLLTFQVAMVAGIIYISGERLSYKLATEFLGTMGINVGVGLVLREGARAAVRGVGKLLLPGLGNAVSGLVAAGGTYAIGRAATGYFIEGVSLAEARDLLNRAGPLKSGWKSLFKERPDATHAELPDAVESAPDSSENGHPDSGTRLPANYR